MFGLPTSELALLAIALGAGGVATGLLAGLLGIGGGGIIVPVLYELFGILGVDESVRMHVSVATSLAIIVPTSIRSFQAHLARGAVAMSVIRTLAPWVAAGVIAGVFAGAAAPASILKGVFAASALFMASRLIFSRQSRGEEGTLPGPPADQAAGFAIGLISTLIGIGGGAYISGYMTFYGWPIHKAVATAAGFGPVIAIPAVIGYTVSGWGNAALPPLSLGFVSIAGVAIVAPISALAAPFGAKIAHRLSRRKLELAFAIFLLAVAARFLISFSIVNYK